MIFFVKQAILKHRSRKLCKFGKKSIISRNTRFSGNNYLGRCTLAKNLDIGYCSYVGDCSIVNNVYIGPFSCISHCVKVVEGTHPTNKIVSIHPSFYDHNYFNSYVEKSIFNNYIYLENSKYACKIGADVWVGYGAIILSGVTIGDGAIVGAGAVVTKDVEPYTIVAGNPAKVIRKRFTDDQISKLKEIEWWNKPKKWLEENAHKFSDIEIFLNDGQE